MGQRGSWLPKKLSAVPGWSLVCPGSRQRMRGSLSWKLSELAYLLAWKRLRSWDWAFLSRKQRTMVVSQPSPVPWLQSHCPLASSRIHYRHQRGKKPCPGKDSRPVVLMSESGVASLHSAHQDPSLPVHWLDWYRTHRCHACCCPWKVEAGSSTREHLYCSRQYEHGWSFPPSQKRTNCHWRWRMTCSVPQFSAIYTPCGFRVRQ